MKKFSFREIDEAKEYAAAGGQALHLHRIIVDRKKAPMCFVAAVARGEDIAHLFDQDTRRLERTVRRLGVRIVVVEHEGRPGQHVDLCAGPLKKALLLCEPDEASVAPDQLALKPGDAVDVTLDDGRTERRSVKYAPWQLGDGRWVVGLSGISGGYDLGRVVPAPQA